MGGINVKITIVERVLQIIAPHPCFGCGKVGSVLCDYCKYDITSEPFVGCILCGRPHFDGICLHHNSPIVKSMVVSPRTGVVEVLVNGLKFRYMKSAAKTCAELLHESLPLLPDDTVIVPIPTVASHVRQRGYDQVELIARQFAALRSLKVAPLLKRLGTATQHQLNKDDRAMEAKQAFTLSDMIGVKSTILILDDIITTGSTVLEASKLLSKNGNMVLVAAIAYQPLD